MKKSFNSSLLNLLIIVLVMVLALSPLFPLRVKPASAPSDEFSAERAMTHLPFIAKSSHPSGSPEQALVREYLVEQLTGLGLEVEIQDSMGAENVIARLRGTNSGDAILILAHYDSLKGPGAADNGAGVAALLEIMRALTASPVPRNDIIALFDDGEELPDAFTGTKAFIRSHPWMDDVRVAIGLDTAVRGFIATDDTGKNNGWMVKILARAYTNGVWTSLSGGGGYDTRPFREAGIRVLELEDNYPFHQQHTKYDVPEIVSPGSVQQLGEQALAVTRELINVELNNTSGAQRTYLYVPYIGLLHYPQTWALPLAILATILLITAIGFALWKKSATWGGLGVAFLAILITAGLAALGINAVWKAAPGIFEWETHLWKDWPEVIPPNGWLLFILSKLVILVLFAFVYRFLRRWSSKTSFSLLGLFIVLLFAVALAISEPKAAIIATWPVMIGGLVWIIALGVKQKNKKTPLDMIAMIASIPTILYLIPLIPATFMGDGTKSVAIEAGAWVIVLAIILPSIDSLLVRPETRLKDEN